MNLLALAIAPGLAIMLYIYLRDKYDREPVKLLLWCFLMGVFSILPAVWLSGSGMGFLNMVLPYESTPYNLVKAFIVVALSEEFSKFAMVYIFAFNNKHFNESFDGIVYAVMVSMGFATLENIMYVYQYGVETGIMRMFTAVPAHATFAILMGYYMGQAKFDALGRKRLLFTGLFWAVAFHGAYDYFLFEIVNYPAAFSGAIVSLVVSLVLSRKALALHSNASPFRKTA